MVRRSFCAVAVALLACVAALPVPALDDPATHRRRNRPVNEWELKDPVDPGNPPPVRAPHDTASYDGSNVGGPSWDRPIGCGPTISGLGPVRYHLELITVDADGAYDVGSAQDHDGYLHLYADAFDPSPPNQPNHCLGANDDGPDGIGTSEIRGLHLAPGVSYFLVTSGFSAAEEGSFTNTLSGPGTITIGDRGPDLAITVTPSVANAAAGDQFWYSIEVANEGPGDVPSVEVTTALSSNLRLDGATCGTFPWTIRQLAESTSITCTVAVTLDACGPASLTADAGGADPDDPADNRATGTVNPNSMADPSFEDGTPSSFSQEASTRFGTPLCNVAGCGTGTGTGPGSGGWWAWFGGIPAREESSLAQSITIPTGDRAFLRFELEAFVCSGSAADFLEVTIDGTRVFSVDATDARCGVLGYSTQTIDVTAFADGAAHTLKFHSVTASHQTSNFFVDDVSVFACRGVVVPQAPGIPTLDTVGLALLALALAGGAMLFIRRRRAA